MSGAVCEMFNCRFSIVDLFLRGGDPVANRKCDIECFPQSLAKRNPRPSKCVPGGIRTPNLLIRSQKLYPVELQAQDTPLMISYNDKWQNSPFHDVTVLTI